MKHKVLITFILFYFLVSCNPQTNSPEQTINQTPLKTDSVNILGKRIDSLLMQDSICKKELEAWFTDEDIKSIKRMGIKDPLSDIKADIIRHPELIPFAGKLGGRMHFRNIMLLRSRWAIADFDDGHNMGTLILRFRIEKDTSIKWIVVDKYLE